MHPFLQFCFCFDAESFSNSALINEHIQQLCNLNVKIVEMSMDDI